MPRFVVLLHEPPPGYSRGTHYDLMLEFGPVLRTWALSELPVVGRTLVADRLPDHRLAYLDFEGQTASVGQVRRVAAGEYRLLDESPGAVVVMLMRSDLQGRLSIVAEEPEPPGSESQAAGGAASAQRWRISLSAD